MSHEIKILMSKTASEVTFIENPSLEKMKIHNTNYSTKSKPSPEHRSINAPIARTAGSDYNDPKPVR